ncbi:accessory gene regulator B family protein [Paenibacillus cisolokensis]|uniref:accessory gene regulator ArgB-like protein n=1 Tax=Paenibacillus TaxID=44249 RepID=UPI000722558E|nr:accessory gene regulator B family protein [Paenibacillus sp. 32O-W]ALS26838.1 post-translational modification of quorum-sensing peptide protein [Paenibacillus sp. 32O-W]
MIEAMAERIAVMIKRSAPDHTASIAVMRFSLIAILNTFFALVLAFSIGLATGSFWETVMASIAFIILRFFSGGIHLRTSTACTIASVAMLSIIPHLPYTDESIFWLNVISVGLLIVFAPSNIKGYARIPERYFPLLKLISVLIASSNFFFNHPILGYSFFFQSLLTISIIKRR